MFLVNLGWWCLRIRWLDEDDDNDMTMSLDLLLNENEAISTVSEGTSHPIDAAKFLIRIRAFDWSSNCSSFFDVAIDSCVHSFLGIVGSSEGTYHRLEEERDEKQEDDGQHEEVEVIKVDDHEGEEAQEANSDVKIDNDDDRWLKFILDDHIDERHDSQWVLCPRGHTRDDDVKSRQNYGR